MTAPKKVKTITIEVDLFEHETPSPDLIANTIGGLILNRMAAYVDSVRIIK